MIKLYSANADLWADTLSDIIDSYDAAKKTPLKTALQNLSYNYYLDNKRF